MHTKEKCFELHGYPDWWENNRKGKGKSANSSRTLEVERVESSPISDLSQEQYKQLMSLLSSITPRALIQWLTLLVKLLLLLPLIMNGY